MAPASTYAAKPVNGSHATSFVTSPTNVPTKQNQYEIYYKPKQYPNNTSIPEDFKLCYRPVQIPEKPRLQGKDLIFLCISNKPTKDNTAQLREQVRSHYIDNFLRDQGLRNSLVVPSSVQATSAAGAQLPSRCPELRLKLNTKPSQRLPIVQLPSADGAPTKHRLHTSITKINPSIAQKLPSVEIPSAAGASIPVHASVTNNPAALQKVLKVQLPSAAGAPNRQLVHTSITKVNPVVAQKIPSVEIPSAAGASNRQTEYRLKMNSKALQRHPKVQMPFAAGALYKQPVHMSEAINPAAQQRLPNFQIPSAVGARYRQPESRLKMNTQAPLKLPIVQIPPATGAYKTHAMQPSRNVTVHAGANPNLKPLFAVTTANKTSADASGMVYPVQVSAFSPIIPSSKAVKRKSTGVMPTLQSVKRSANIMPAAKNGSTVVTPTIQTMHGRVPAHPVAGVSSTGNSNRATALITPTAKARSIHPRRSYSTAESLSELEKEVVQQLLRDHLSGTRPAWREQHADYAETIQEYENSVPTRTVEIGNVIPFIDLCSDDDEDDPNSTPPSQYHNPSSLPNACLMMPYMQSLLQSKLPRERTDGSSTRTRWYERLQKASSPSENESLNCFSNYSSPDKWSHQKKIGLHYQNGHMQ